MFDDYKKRLEELGDNVPKTFSRVAKLGSVHFVNEAQERTDNEGLVDTGAYKRNWYAIPSYKDEVHRIHVGNVMIYSSDLEYGHRTRKEIKEGVAFGQGQKCKGKFVGRMSLDNTKAWVKQELRTEIKAIMLAKKTGVTRGQARKALNS